MGLLRLQSAFLILAPNDRTVYLNAIIFSLQLVLETEDYAPEKEHLVDQKLKSEITD